MEADLDGHARRDVGQALGEEVGPLLLEQTGGLTGLLGRFIGLAGLLAGVDLAADGSRADRQRVVVDRRVLVEREHVDRLDRLRERVAEHLDDLGLGHGADDHRVEAGLLQRQIEELVARRVAEAERARAGLELRVRDRRDRHAVT